MDNIPKYVDQEIREGLNRVYWEGLPVHKILRRLELYGLVDDRGNLTEKGKNLRNKIINMSESIWKRKTFMKNHPAYKPSRVKTF